VTVNDLAQNLMREQDEATDNTEMVDTVESWISDAVDELASACDWRIFKVIFPLSTVASQPDYELDAQYNDIRSIRFVDTDETIDYIDEPRLYHVSTDIEETGKPRVWFFNSADDDVGQQPQFVITLNPIPDAIYSLQVSAQKHPLIAPIGSTTDIPLRQEMLLAVKNRVRAYILASDKDYEGSTTHLQMFYKQVDDMIKKESTRPAARHVRLQVTDIVGNTGRRHPILDPSHFSNR
jgi:hypothetical protein